MNAIWIQLVSIWVFLLVNSIREYFLFKMVKEIHTVLLICPLCEGTGDSKIAPGLKCEGCNNTGHYRRGR
jgi:hypothetical protein